MVCSSRCKPGSRGFPWLFQGGIFTSMQLAGLAFTRSFLLLACPPLTLSSATVWRPVAKLVALMTPLRPFIASADKPRNSTPVPTGLSSETLSPISHAIVAPAVGLLVVAAAAAGRATVSSSELARQSTTSASGRRRRAAAPVTSQG